MNLPVPEAPFFSSDRLPAARVNPPEKVLEPAAPPITKRPELSLVKVAEAPPDTKPESVIVSVLSGEKDCRADRTNDDEIVRVLSMLNEPARSPNDTPLPKMASVPPVKVREELAVLAPASSITTPNAFPAPATVIVKLS